MSDYIFAPPTVRVSFSVEPALNVYESLSLLSSTDELSGLNEWVEQTVKTLSTEQRHVNDMIFSIGACIRPDTAAHLPDFPSYIRWLEAQDPASYLTRGLDWLFKEPISGESLPDMEGIYSDVDVFIEYVERWHKAKKADKGYTLNPQPFRDVFPYLQKPEAFKALILSHMREMWQTVLKPEWERKLPILQEAVDAFEAMDYHNLTALEAMRAVTGRDVSYLDWKWAEHIIFIPSPHMGPYITPYWHDDGKSMWLMFGVRMPQGTRGRSTELSRSELNMRLSALADDTRLLIMELVAQKGELCAQDIITLLDLSQSAASRNLRQLTATGYLIERRRETAKCYSLNYDRVDDTMKALRRFLRKHK